MYAPCHKRCLIFLLFKCTQKTAFVTGSIEESNNGGIATVKADETAASDRTYWGLIMRMFIGMNYFYLVLDQSTLSKQIEPFQYHIVDPLLDTSEKTNHFKNGLILSKGIKPRQLNCPIQPCELTNSLVQVGTGLHQ
jgi:hypothetical protein